MCSLEEPLWVQIRWGAREKKKKKNGANVDDNRFPDTHLFGSYLWGGGEWVRTPIPISHGQEDGSIGMGRVDVVAEGNL